ncbi:MAG: hypothetical protein RX316_09735 [bacterium]|nr:hypothetical protein [bacterium]
MIGLIGIPNDLITWSTLLKEISPYVNHNIARWAFVILGLAIFSIPYMKTVFLIGEPDIVKRLTRRKRIKFGEIADALADETIGMGRNEVIYQLLKAIWQGDFENKAGKSRLVLELPELQVGDVPLDRDRRRIAVPPIWEYNRRIFLSVLRPFQNVDVPGNRTLLDKSISWKTIKSQVPFDVLSTIKPSEYRNDVIRSYIEPLIMTNKDFRRWLSRFRKGKYES